MGLSIAKLFYKITFFVWPYATTFFANLSIRMTPLLSKEVVFTALLSFFKDHFNAYCSFNFTIYRLRSENPMSFYPKKHWNCSIIIDVLLIFLNFLVYA